MARFDISIVATDRASAVIRAVKSDIKSVDKVGKGLVEVSAAARSVADNFARILPPVAALVGSGAIAALGTMINDWVKAGIAVQRLAVVSGVSTSALQTLGGANMMVGGSAESMQQAVANLGNTMQDAFYGRNPMALSMLRQLGIRLEVTGNQANDAESMFLKLSAAIVKLKTPAQQMLVARTFGMEEQLPLLLKGPVAIAAMQKAWRDTGAVITNTKLVEDANTQHTLLYGSILGVRNALVEELGPAIVPVTQGLREWIVANRELLGEIGIGLGGVSLLGSLIFLTRAVIGLGSAIIISPIGILVTTLVGAAVLVYENWDKVRLLWIELKKTWDDMGKPVDEKKVAADRQKADESTNALVSRGAAALGIPPDEQERFRGQLGRVIDRTMTALDSLTNPSAYPPVVEPPAAPVLAPAPSTGIVPRVEMTMPPPLQGPYAPGGASGAASTPAAPTAFDQLRSTPQQIVITFENLPTGWTPRVVPTGNGGLGIGRPMSPAVQ